MKKITIYHGFAFLLGLVIGLGVLVFQSQIPFLGAQSNFSGPVNSTAGFQESGTTVIDTNGAYVYTVSTTQAASFNAGVTFVTEVTGSYCGTATWNPNAVGSSTVATTSLTVTGLALGDATFAGFSATTTDIDDRKLVLDAEATAADTALVQFSFPRSSDGTINPVTGTVSVCYWD